MFQGIRSYAQNLAEKFMEAEVVITHRMDPDEDPENPYGDDTIEWEPVKTTTKGWLVSQLTKTLDNVGGVHTLVEQANIRLPVGTRIDSGDSISINGRDWSVNDVSNDETWPAMLKVSLSRIF